jgi:seryl-tRNA synthetase
MLDPRIIRENPKEVEKKLHSKDPEISLSEISRCDSEQRNLQIEVEELKSIRNKLSKEIGLKKRSGDDTSEAMKKVSLIGEEISEKDTRYKEINLILQDTLARLPNLPESDIPVSLDPKDNICIKTFLEKPKLPFTPKNHLELAESCKLLDMARGAKISGTGWPIYTGIGARLEWALLNYMLDIHLKNGFEMRMLPHLVRPEIMYGSGQLPKFEKQLFKITDDDYNLYLLPTSEVALNGLHSDEIIPESELPKKFVSYSPCFRREAGAAGTAERGLIRVHQFNKVEMFALCKPDESEELFHTLVRGAEEVLQGLELHYRNMLLVTGDMSFQAARTVDIEVWLPGQNRYYEVSSISNCTDFQARRSKIRFKGKEGKPQLVHSLNGSGVATARLLVALLENNQREDGSISIPKALQKYVGTDKITPIC